MEALTVLEGLRHPHRWPEALRPEECAFGVCGLQGPLVMGVDGSARGWCADGAGGVLRNGSEEPP